MRFLQGAAVVAGFLTTAVVAATPPIISPALDAALRAVPDRPQRVWVFFADKAGAGDAAADALDHRLAELSPRSIARRLSRRTAAGVADQRDLPIAAGYRDALRAAGVRIRHESRWLNAVSADASPDQVRAMAGLPFVVRIQPVARAAPRPLPAVEHAPADQPSVRGPGAAFYGQSYDQLAQINVVAAHAAGFTGAGIRIGILDTGFRRTHTAFNQTGGAHPVQVIDEHDFVDNDANTAPEPNDDPDQHRHGTYILGTMGAYHPTVLVGAAYDASFILAKTEDITQEVPAEEDAYVAGLEWVEARGADLVTSSLGYIDWYSQADLDGQTAVTTLAVNVATENGLVCCTAAGNSGNDASPFTSRLIAPADALSVLTCGAVDADGLTAWFSSDGPTADGRVKPELLARGIDTMTVSAVGDVNIVPQGGTSLSTPLLAGGIALVIQAHPDWSVDKIRRALLHTAAGFNATAQPDPLFVRGYGIVNIAAAINFVHGDINGDGRADGRDVQRFIAALTGQNPDSSEMRGADANASGAVNAADVPIFVGDLLGT